MIIRNEQYYLADCLDSIKEIVDEIVIVDTGSTDQGKNIAQSFGARVFDFPWCDDFAAARNESLRHSRGEWILYIDADERARETGSELQPKNMSMVATCCALSRYFCLSMLPRYCKRPFRARVAGKQCFPVLGQPLP